MTHFQKAMVALTIVLCVVAGVVACCADPPPAPVQFEGGR